MKRASLTVQAVTAITSTATAKMVKAIYVPLGDGSLIHSVSAVCKSDMKQSLECERIREPPILQTETNPIGIWAFH